jgi:heme exporter protein D
MPATERYQVDFFAIIVLIAAVLIIVFLIIASIYFFNLMDLKPPTRGESTFLFWTAIVLTIIFLVIAIIALIRIFTHKAIVYEEELQQRPPLVRTTTVTTAPAPVPVAVVTTPAPIPVAVTAPTPLRISNIPRTLPPSDISVSVSDVPVTQTQRTALNEELISLGSALEA